MFTPVQWKRIIHGLVDCGYGGIKGTKKCQSGTVDGERLTGNEGDSINKMNKLFTVA